MRNHCVSCSKPWDTVDLADIFSLKANKSPDLGSESLAERATKAVYETHTNTLSTMCWIVHSNECVCVCVRVSKWQLDNKLPLYFVCLSKLQGTTELILYCVFAAKVIETHCIGLFVCLCLHMCAFVCWSFPGSVKAALWERNWHEHFKVSMQLNGFVLIYSNQLRGAAAEDSNFYRNNKTRRHTNYKV